MIHPIEFAPQIQSVWMMAQGSRNWQTPEAVPSLQADDNGLQEP